MLKQELEYFAEKPINLAGTMFKEVLVALLKTTKPQKQGGKEDE